MRMIGAAPLGAAVLLAAAPAVAQDAEADQAAYAEMMRAVTDRLDPARGLLPLPGAPVMLDVPESFDFYDAEDARSILEEIWGNPPDNTVLGMLFPAQYSPVDFDAWGVALTYEDTGYVSDDDANSTDYDELLRDMQAATEEENRYREREGYQTLELIGWAVPPHYDAAEHTIYWAKDIVFEGVDGYHTLNYDMRALGRRGVLSMNFIAGLDDLPEIEAAAPAVMAIPSFNPGEAYADYQPGDRKAGYGLAALVAGGAGVALAKKAGLIGILLLVLKKAWFVIVIALGAVWRGAKALTGRGKA